MKKYTLLIFIGCIACGFTSCLNEEDFAPFYEVSTNPISSVATSKAIFLKEQILKDSLQTKTGHFVGYEVLACRNASNQDYFIVSKSFSILTVYSQKLNMFGTTIEGEGKMYEFNHNGGLESTWEAESIPVIMCKYNIVNGNFTKAIEVELFKDIHDMDATYFAKIKNTLKNKISDYADNISFM